MKNVRTEQLKTVIVMACDEYEQILSKIFNEKVIIHTDLDGIWYEVNADDDFEANLNACLANYFGVTEVTSIHADDCEEVGIWITYKT